MKKVLSVMLVVMMVISLFVINTSALISDTYTVVEGAADEAVAVNQTYDGTNVADFVEGDYGFATITEDGINLTAKDADKENGSVDDILRKGPMHIGTETDVARGQYVMEFDITKNDDLVGMQSATAGYNYGVYVSAKRPGNAGTALDQYGVFVPVCVNTQGGTYKYKIIFDEAAVIAALEADGKETVSNNTDRQTYGAKLMKVYELAPGANDYVLKGSVSSYAYTTTLNGKVRFFFGNVTKGAFDTFNLYFNSDTSTSDCKFDESDYTIDNIKIYAPAVEGTEVAYDYDFCEGEVVAEAIEEQVLPYGTVGSKRVIFENVVSEKYSPWAMTFDAVNTVVGQPLTVCMSSDYSDTAGTHIRSTEEIKDKWYTYKLMYEFSNYTGQSRMTPLTAYRKEVGSDVWEKIILGEDYIVNRDGVTKSIRNFFEFITWNKDVKAFDVFTEGEWKIRNVQVVPVTAVCGNAEIVDGNIVADINITANGARTAYAVTYSQGRLVDVDYVPIAADTDTFSVLVPYSAGTVDSVALYVWDNNAEPTLEVIDLLSAAQK